MMLQDLKSLRASVLVLTEPSNKHAAKQPGVKDPTEREVQLLSQAQPLAGLPAHPPPNAATWIGN